MHEEIIDIYDENMTHIGYAPKKEAHKKGLWHKSIHCWLFNSVDSEKYVVIQKRAASKLLMPNYYDVSVAGHYEKGEKKSDGFREVWEEFGIKVPPNSWNYLGIKFDIGISPNAINKEFCEVFFAEIHEHIHKFKLSKEEVDAVVFVRVEDGLRLFSGETSSITASGIQWNKTRTDFEDAVFSIRKDEFIPRTDPYYARVFVLADLYFRGYKYLFI